MKLNKPFIKKIPSNLANPKSGWQLALLVLGIAIAYAIRAHPYITNPQLFAEDGALWLAEGYDRSVSALFQTVNGFLHFPERLFGYVVAHLSLHYAPLIFVLSAWVLFVLLAYYLLTPRTKILKNNYERLFMAGSLVLIANIEVFFFNFSNSAFLMGIIAVLIMVAQKSRFKIVAVGEKIFFLLSCFTLMFAWILLPIAIFERIRCKRKGLFFLIASSFGTLVELIYYITSHVNRSPVTLFSLVSKYAVLELYNQTIIPALRFARVDVLVSDYSAHYYNFLSVYLIVVLFLLATVYVFKKANKEVRYLLLFLGLMTFASFKSPTITVRTAEEALKSMAVVTQAGRYFVYGIVGFSLVIGKTSYYAITDRFRYIFLCIFFSIGLVSSIHYGSFYINKGFVNLSQEYKQGINKLESGKVKSVLIPENPVPWHLYLRK